MLLDTRTLALPRISLASCSEIGARRTNEDDLRCGRAGLAWYAVLADGAGGHRAGAVASARAVEALEAQSIERVSFWSPEALADALRVANTEVRQGQGDKPLAERMLTTAVLLWVDPGRQQALWSHVGDSRLYRLRGGRVDFVTRDDSVVQDLLDAGLLTAAQARKHPHKNQLVAALGLDEELAPHAVSGPESVEEGDAYLLCSDGWWDSLCDAQIIETLNNADTPQHWLQLMRECIEARLVPNQDNFSAVALWVGDPWDRS